MKLPASRGDCVFIESKYAKTEQTAGFQSFRMRTFKVRGHCCCHKKVSSFPALKSLSLMVERLRSKAFSPVCLSRFLEFLTFIPITTRSSGRRESSEGGIKRERGNWIESLPAFGGY